MKVLVPGHDHQYREVEIRTRKVVHNPKWDLYSEYFGDEYLEPDEVVIEAQVAE